MDNCTEIGRMVDQGSFVEQWQEPGFVVIA
jgi:hypothetical protein